jgi:FlaA1/EpsC-like NDP-sugar epimerase
MTNPFTQIRGYRRASIVAIVYILIVASSFYLAYSVRFDFNVPLSYREQRLHYIGLVILFKLTALIAAGQFRILLTYFGIPDLLRVFWAMTVATAILLMVYFLDPHLIRLPRGVLLVDYLLCMTGLCTARLSARLYRERMSPNQVPNNQSAQRIAIVGAGDAGASLASEFLNNPRRGFRPVAFFDDDPKKHRKLVHGIPVVGPPDLIAKIAGEEQITKIVIAMPSAAARRIRDIVQFAHDAALKVETLPSLAEMASGQIRASRIRPVEVQDLLGREAVNLDSEAIRGLISERVVLVTGAGGSIGGELCRQIAALNPKRLLMVERSEGNLFVIEQELNEMGLGVAGIPLVADISDLERMERIFSCYSPQVIFHAAAHKHVFLMERQPAEAISNNVFGTRRIARLAVKHGVESFILISTDKAVNPTSVMGATKRLAEIQIQAIHSAQRPPKTKFMAVRFGNVLGSSGSVIPIFKRQIANGGPVTVTHPDITRYFMTIPEAVGLVLQSAVLGRGGEIFVLDMGQPIKILDLARQMIILSGFRPGDDIEIKFTGLKPGEKLFEELQHTNEKHQPTEHPKIMRFINESPFNEAQISDLEEALHESLPNDLKGTLKKLIPEFDPYLD